MLYRYGLYVVLVWLWTAPTVAQELAFPGAEGFGRFAQGGRGGRTIEVTNLNNAGPGSLRQCLEVDSGPRICVPTVSGTISLSPIVGNDAGISIVHDYVTFDGSLGPDGGLALKDGGLNLKANHIIIRHLRVRPGPSQWLARGLHANAFAIQGNEGVPKHDIILDHVSGSWSTDDLLYVIYGNDNVTVQWSIFSEGLINCPGSCGGKGFLMGYGARSVSFHHNLSAHNWIRWPEATGGGNNPGFTGRLDFVNNVQYNGNGTDTIVDPYHGPIYVNFVGNYWEDGLDVLPQNTGKPAIRALGGLPYSSQSGIFVQDNYGRYQPVNCPGCNAVIGQAVPDERILWGDNGGIPKVTVRYPYPPVTTTSPAQAYDEVLAGAGAFPRDAVDTRVIHEVRTGTGHWLDHSKTPLTPASWPLLTGGPSSPPLPPQPPTDTDGDGVPDSSDQCPTVPGPVSTHGCPIVTPPPVEPPPMPIPSARTTVETTVTTITSSKTKLRVTKSQCPGGFTSTGVKTYDANGAALSSTAPTWATKELITTCKP